MNARKTTVSTVGGVKKEIVAELQAIKQEYWNDRKIIKKVGVDYYSRPLYGIVSEGTAESLPSEYDMDSAKISVVVELMKHETIHDVKHQLDFVEYVALMNDYGLERNVAPLQQLQSKTQP